jgi:hypothetical protein
MAASQVLGVRRRIDPLKAEGCSPSIRRRHQAVIQPGAQFGKRSRKRVVEILLLALAEPMACHHDLLRNMSRLLSS